MLLISSAHSRCCCLKNKDLHTDKNLLLSLVFSCFSTLLLCFCHTNTHWKLTLVIQFNSIPCAILWKTLLAASYHINGQLESKRKRKFKCELCVCRRWERTKTIESASRMSANHSTSAAAAAAVEFAWVSRLKCWVARLKQSAHLSWFFMSRPAASHASQPKLRAPFVSVSANATFSHTASSLIRPEIVQARALFSRQLNRL